MVAIKSQNASAVIAAPDQRHWAFLIYGPDAGLVAERAFDLSQTLARRQDPPGEPIRLDESDLEADPDRLGLELLTMPMFGGRKIVRVSASRRMNILKLKPIVQEAQAAGILIVEAGQLRRDDALKLLFEKAPHAAAIPCYADDESVLDRLIEETITAHGLTISGPVRQALIAQLGADRMMSRSELEKLAVYVTGRSEITSEDVEAVIGDASEQTIDRVINAAALGDAKTAVVELHRAMTAGDGAQSIILAMQRHFIRLHRLAVAIASGRSAEAAIRELKPPLHFKVSDMLAAHCRRWRLPKLERALDAIAEAARKARWMSAQEELLAERLVLHIAQLAAAERR